MIKAQNLSLAQWKYNAGFFNYERFNIHRKSLTGYKNKEVIHAKQNLTQWF